MQFFVWLILNPALGGSYDPKCLGNICMYTYIYIKGIILPSFVGMLANHYKDPYSTLNVFFVFDSQASSEWTVLLVWMFGEKIRGNFMKLHRFLVDGMKEIWQKHQSR